MSGSYNELSDETEVMFIIENDCSDPILIKSFKIGGVYVAPEKTQTTRSILEPYDCSIVRLRKKGREMGVITIQASRYPKDSEE